MVFIFRIRETAGDKRLKEITMVLSNLLKSSPVKWDEMKSMVEHLARRVKESLGRSLENLLLNFRTLRRSEASNERG